MLMQLSGSTTEKAVCDYNYNGKLKPRNTGSAYELVQNWRIAF